MVNAGLDQKMAMTIGGWKTDAVFRRYRITLRKDLRRAADKMDEFFQKEAEARATEVTKIVTVDSGEERKPADQNMVN
jgi:hypothetical protein